MHIRVTDAIFQKDINFTLENATSHFACAEQYILERNMENSSVIFLVSNSLKVRIQAKQLYGDRLITDTMTHAAHTGNMS